MLLDGLLKPNVIQEIIADQYGNYVVQKALQVSDGMRFMNIIQV